MAETRSHGMLRLHVAALDIISKAHGAKDLVVIRSVEGQHPASGSRLFMIRGASAKDPNGPSHDVVLDTRLTEVKLSAAETAAAFGTPVPKPKGTVSPRSGSGASGGGGSGSGAITIDPDYNDLVLEFGDELNETITVKIPGNPVVPKVDVYFLADSTGSMGGRSVLSRQTPVRSCPRWPPASRTSPSEWVTTGTSETSTSSTTSRA